MKPGFTERTIAQFELNLTFDQQDYIEENWRKHTPVAMARLLFNDNTLDERSQEAENVKRYYAKIHRNKPLIELDADQRAFIETNAVLMKPLEIAKTLFPQRDIKPLSAEVRTITRYTAAIGSIYNNDESALDEIYEDEYEPPNTDTQLIKKINEADINSNYDIRKLSAFQKRCLEALRKNLHSPRFLCTIRSYNKKSKQQLFESTMIQSTYDKPDLTSEELNMFINLCSDYVLMLSLQVQMDKIDQLLNSCVDDDDDSKKLQMALAEALSAKIQEYDKCQSRMQKLQESLSGKRNQRLESEATVNDSLTKLVELWKDEKERAIMLRAAEARNVELDKEIDRLESLSEYMARVMGVSREEIINN